MAPAVAVEGIAFATAFTEDRTTVISLVPAREELTEFDQLIGKGSKNWYAKYDIKIFSNPGNS